MPEPLDIAPSVLEHVTINSHIPITLPVGTRMKLVTFAGGMSFEAGPGSWFVSEVSDDKKTITLASDKTDA